MRHLAAYLMLVAGGNAAPTAADVKDLLTKSNVAVDDERLASLIKELEGKDIDEIIAAGKEQLIPITSGGGGAAPAAAAGAAEEAAPAAAAKPKEEEVDPMEGGMSMFGGGDGGDY